MVEDVFPLKCLSYPTENQQNADIVVLVLFRGLEGGAHTPSRLEFLLPPVGSVGLDFQPNQEQCYMVLLFPKSLCAMQIVADT